MLRNLKDLYAFSVAATDGLIGQTKDFYFDDRTWTIRFLVVETDAWLARRRVLISPIAIGHPDWTGRVLPASLTRTQVRKSPDIDTHQPVSRQHEMQYAGYYGYPYYWGGSGLWGEGMHPAAMLAAYTGATSPELEREEKAFVAAQALIHRQEGDDPHLRSSRAILRYHLHASDGDVGHVDGMLVDDETWSIRYLIVNTSDWWLGHKVLIAPQWIEDVSWLEATVSVGLTRRAVKDAPVYDGEAVPDRPEEAAIHEHYARPGYWGQAGKRETEASHP